MLFRIGIFAVLLSMATDTPWILYYIVMLHSLHFLMIFLFASCGGFEARCCCYRGTKNSASFVMLLPVFAKLLILAVAYSILWLPVVWDSTVGAVLHAVYPSGAKEVYFRTSVDRYSSLMGALLGAAWAPLMSVFSFFKPQAASSKISRQAGASVVERAAVYDEAAEALVLDGINTTDNFARVLSEDSSQVLGSVSASSLPTHSRHPGRAAPQGRFVGKLCIWLSSCVLFLGSLFVFFLFNTMDWPHKKYIVEIHPFTGLLWVPLFILVRNSTPTLRSTYLAPLAFLGRHSLEMYLLQSHMLLSHKATRLLVLLPSMPLVNLLLVWSLYCVAAWRCFLATAGLRRAFSTWRTKAALGGVLLLMAAFNMLLSAAVGQLDWVNSSRVSFAMGVVLGVLAGLAFHCTIRWQAAKGAQATQGAGRRQCENRLDSIELDEIAAELETPAGGASRQLAATKRRRNLRRCWVVSWPLAVGFLVPLSVSYLYQYAVTHPTTFVYSMVPAVPAGDHQSPISADEVPTAAAPSQPPSGPGMGSPLPFNATRLRSNVQQLLEQLHSYYQASGGEGKLVLQDSMFLQPADTTGGTASGGQDPRAAKVPHRLILRRFCLELPVLALPFPCSLL